MQRQRTAAFKALHGAPSSSSDQSAAKPGATAHEVQVELASHPAGKASPPPVRPASEADDRGEVADEPCKSTEDTHDQSLYAAHPSTGTSHLAAHRGDTARRESALGVSKTKPARYTEVPPPCLPLSLPRRRPIRRRRGLLVRQLFCLCVLGTIVLLVLQADRARDEERMRQERGRPNARIIRL